MMQGVSVQELNELQAAMDELKRYESESNNSIVENGEGYNDYQ